MTDLTERADATRDELAKLKAWRGSALLDGKAIDHAPIRNAEGDLEAIGDAETEAVRRERQSADEAAERARADELLALVDVWSAIPAEVAGMVADAKSLSRRWDKIEALYADVRKRLIANGWKVPAAAIGPELRQRMSALSALYLAKPHKSLAFGYLFSRAIGWLESKREVDWAAEETKTINAEIELITKGKSQ